MPEILDPNSPLHNQKIIDVLEFFPELLGTNISQGKIKVSKPKLSPPKERNTRFISTIEIVHFLLVYSTQLNNGAYEDEIQNMQFLEKDLTTIKQKMQENLKQALENDQRTSWTGYLNILTDLLAIGTTIAGIAALLSGPAGWAAITIVALFGAASTAHHVDEAFFNDKGKEAVAHMFTDDPQKTETTKKAIGIASTIFTVGTSLFGSFTGTGAAKMLAMTAAAYNTVNVTMKMVNGRLEVFISRASDKIAYQRKILKGQTESNMELIQDILNRQAELLEKLAAMSRGDTESKSKIFIS